MQSQMSNLPSNLVNIRNYYSDQSSRRDLVEAVEVLNQLLTPQMEVLQFKLGEITNEVILVDLKNNRIIRTVPTSEVLSIARSLTKLNDMSMDSMSERRVEHG